MRRVFLSLALGLTFLLVSTVLASAETKYNYGDYTSVTLTVKAWKALDGDDLDAVLAYTKKCIDLYAKQARKMQVSLDGYVSTKNKDEVFSKWALNDVGTCYFIRGEAYLKADKTEEAKKEFQTLIDNYGFAQCWDPQGWFWKPAEEAKNKLEGRESGYSSADLTTKAWEALDEGNLEDVLHYTQKCIDLYFDVADNMQASLNDYVPTDNEQDVFDKWALNDVGTCYFIRGEAYLREGKIAKAKKEFKILVDKYKFAQCWDPRGWFWKPAEGAANRIEGL